ncbi:MAG: methionine synthase [Bacteriovoracaceae bacterium]
MEKQTRVSLLKSLIKSRILVLDGAMGTAIQDKNLIAADFGGPQYEGCNEYLVITKPQVIFDIHMAYLEAGADIVETNTFGATPLVLAEYDLASRAHEINVVAAKLARKAADEYSAITPHKPRFVAGSIGPTTKAISVTGGVTFEELEKNFYEQARALYEGGVDYFLLETCQDTRNIKAGILGINRFLKEVDVKLPLAVSGTIEPMGTMLAGQAVDSLATSLEHVDLLYIGLNCATGPEFMTDHVRTLAGMTSVPVSCVPNAGLPDENGQYLETPQMLATSLSRFLQKGWVSVIGGCCGTHSGHIKEMAALAEKYSPVPHEFKAVSRLSGVDVLEVTESDRPFFVGERTNVIGSKKFKELIVENKFDEATEIAKNQVKKGAHLIDVCLANPDRDEAEDMKRFLELLVKKIKVPLMIDSTDEDVIELSLTYSQGKAIINSINLEDGEERFEKVVPLAKKYGAALVVGTIDDDKLQGMGVTRERKLSIAKRSYDLLVNKYGIKPADIYWDPLVFPCATGDENYIGSAAETIEGIRLLKKEFPETKTVLGISNVSFGLPEAGREVLNAIFLYLCTEAGLDLAIVNTEKLKRYALISEEEKLLATNLLYNRGEDPVGKYANFYRGKKKEIVEHVDLPLMERLPRYIIEGSKDGLVNDLNELLKTMPPLEIINGPLMQGMGTVGKLFNDNKLIVAEVLQSAEAMKAAVTHLEQFMEKKDSAKKGKIVLATVKGDVHDIGKNLVDIVLSNNGYEVINLGIKIPSEDLIKAIKQHKPDILGLSGLLVKSAQQMVLSAEDLSLANIDIPIMVGGAALSRNFVNKKIAPSYKGEVMYAKDAMSGLDLANTITHPTSFHELREELKKERANIDTAEVVPEKDKTIFETRSNTIGLLEKPALPPDYDLHVIKNTPIDLILKYINPLMLYGRHLGINGKLVRLIEKEDWKALRAEEGGEKAYDIYQKVEALKNEYKLSHLKPKALYQFFKAKSEKNNLYLSNKANLEVGHFTFPRQAKIDGLCLSDYVTPKSVNVEDSIAMFVVTVGEGIRELSESLKIKGHYLESHAIAALALESAEAYAEYLHGHIRSIWGFVDPMDMTMMERFQAKYHGKRYSFGYPACPRLDDQEILFQLLNPKKEINVELTDGFMMDPEASVSAIVFHHPDATYYSVGDRGDF